MALRSLGSELTLLTLHKEMLGRPKVDSGFGPAVEGSWPSCATFSRVGVNVYFGKHNLLPSDAKRAG